MERTERKSNRALWLTLILLVYIGASVLGIITFNKTLSFTKNIFASAFLGDVLATVFVFAFSLAFRNASVYDPYWSVQPLVILYAFAAAYGLNLHTFVLTAALTVWGIRLTANWCYNFHGLEYQDWRYKMLKEKSGVFYPAINFLGIHMFPTVIVFACMIPAVHLFEYTRNNPPAVLPKWTVGIALCILLAVLLQGTADLQMHRFRRSGTQGLMRQGLWKYSRHPNYLAEILVWWFVGLFAFFATPMPWYYLTGAFANTLMFLFISIPMAENRQSQKVGKEAFAEYKSQTRILLPVRRLGK